MKYDRPEITPVAPAISAIQSSSNKGGHALEVTIKDATMPAYEADE
jgi:hypothetical protein